MSKIEKSTWLSAFLYYNEPWEEFLVKAVEPFVETVLKTGIVESYFFIRYWERGPHIRLRLRGEASALEQVLKPNLIEHFEAYFKENPSERTEPEYPPEYPKDYYWLPNNQIQVLDYEPELNRYAGKIGVNLSEKQFYLSSETVLHYIKQLPASTDYAEQLGLAIRLHLSFVYSLGMDTRTMAAFFNMIFENWLPRAIEVPVNEDNREFILKKMNETVGLFNESFEQQRESLRVFHEHLLKDLRADFAFEDPIFNDWVSGNRKLGLQLTQAAESGKLKKRSETYVFSDELLEQCSDNEILLWNIWADYVHMTNNRLGIFNHDEAYLAYLMKRSLREID